MLHVQETFLNSSLLMQPPVTVVVQPSSSSRSTKVIEQLSNKYDLVQKDIAATKAQLELIQTTKSNHEKENTNNINANKVNRARIKDIMKLLETKQRALESTKATSIQLEQKVKQLKEEALSSRHQLEDLRRREQVLEHDRDTAIKQTNQMKHKQTILHDSIDQLRTRCDREMALLTQDHTILVDQTHYIREKNALLAELVEIRIQQRRHLIQQVVQKQCITNVEVFIEHVRNQMQALETEMGKEEEEYGRVAENLKAKVNELVSKIKQSSEYH